MDRHWRLINPSCPEKYPVPNVTGHVDMWNPDHDIHDPKIEKSVILFHHVSRNSCMVNKVQGNSKSLGLDSAQQTEKGQDTF